MTDLTHIPKRLQERAQEFLNAQPKALAVRFEGNCPVCRRDQLISWMHRDLLDNNDALPGDEWCGYACLVCEWANPGSRPIDSKDEPSCPQCKSTNWRCWDERTEWFRDAETGKLYEHPVGYLKCRDCGKAYVNMDGLEHEHVGTYRDAFGYD